MAAEGGGSAALVALDLAAGSLGGMAGVLVGHPLDVVKTRMQAATSPLRSLSAWDCLSTTYRAEGWSGLWRGIGPPLFSVAFYQSTVFASYEWALKQAMSAGVQEDRARLGAGAVSGAASCLVTVPTDAVKIQLQLERSGSTDPFRCAHRLVARHGVASLFRGMTACLWRDVPATIVYFATYRQAKKAYLAGIGSHVQEDWRNTSAEVLCGGFAGFASWTCAVPLDVVKTTSQEAAMAGRPGGFVGAVQEVLRRDGPRGFMRGAGPILARSFPVNAITFLVYENAKRMMGAPCIP